MTGGIFYVVFFFRFTNLQCLLTITSYSVWVWLATKKQGNIFMKPKFIESLGE